ncbi:IPT/TIG domain-containing protein [Actinoplanes teichomyceticus]|uniref:IPT/TIG domain-containing protein n=1 Tax=Actinoplanes teichomyceticus TaxID=1867 RepID=A0A561WJ14_ACTTI|nr:IPT/TIG domain-containing protein [Actinoplanes teichomyceticus]TWG23810.1 IPT/TIG domain-containing protein [Actinoplanes teichomyceticus]GIF11856.1 hypothetical protein Ate01nite_18880 [Actinoplanes teichomyceticus]
MTHSKKPRRAAGLAAAAVLVAAGVPAVATAAPYRAGATATAAAASAGLTAAFEDRIAARPTGGTVIPVTVGGGTVGATAAAFGTLRITATVGGVSAPVTWVDESHLKVTAPATTKATTATMRLLSKGVPGPESASVVAYRPAVTAVAPARISAAGGATVTISGAGFLGVDATDPAAVTFGGRAATSFTVVSATRITAVAPAGAGGSAAVTVKTTGGVSEASARAAVGYVTPLGIDVTGEPAVKASGGPLVLTVTGGTLGEDAKAFAAEKVTVLMGTKVLAAAYVDETRLRVTAPAAAVDSAPFTVVHNGIPGEPAVVTVAPVVTSLSLRSDVLSGGAKVTVRAAGAGIASASGFTFGANPATCAKQGTGAAVAFLCTVPPAASAGPVAVGFTSGTGTASRFTGAATFSYTDN